MAGFPWEVEGAEGGGNLLWELGAGGGVNGVGGRELFQRGQQGFDRGKSTKAAPAEIERLERGEILPAGISRR